MDEYLTIKKLQEIEQEVKYSKIHFDKKVEDREERLDSIKRAGKTEFLRGSEVQFMMSFIDEVSLLERHVAKMRALKNTEKSDPVFFDRVYKRLMDLIDLYYKEIDNTQIPVEDIVKYKKAHHLERIEVSKPTNALIPDKKPETPPATQQEPNPIMPPAVVPTNTDTTPAGSSSPSAANTNNQAGGSPQTDTSTQQANTQQDKATQKENKPAPKEEEKPKNDLFTPTNILLMLLVVGGGFFLLTRKGK